MGIDPIFHHMMQSALKEIDDSEVLETRAASRRDRAAAQLKQLAELDDEQLLSVLPGTGEGFRQVLQSAREGIQNGLYAMAAVQLQELADQADDQSQAVSSQENAVCEMLQSALKEIQDSEVLETQAASRRDRATAHLKQLAELNEKQLLSVLPEKGPSLHQTLQVALKAIEDHQYATATGQLKQLANLPDKLLAPAREKLSAQEKLSARWTITLQTRLRAVLTEQTIPAVDPEKCRTLETQLYKHLQGKDFAEALKTLDQLEPLLKEAVFQDNLVKGKAQKSQDQTRAHKTMQKRFGIIATTVFRPGYSNHILIKRQGQGQASLTFGAFVEAVKAHEDSRSEATLETLETRGHLLLKNSAAAAEETQIVREVMQWARFDGLRLQYEKIGPPLWNAEKENHAGALTAAYLFEEGALIGRTDEDKTAKPLEDESGASGAWWIRRLGGFSDEETVRQFIFKPVDREPEFGVLPFGGGAIREVMAKAVNDQVALMTGLDFGVCPTYLVGISNERLPELDGRPDTTLAPVRTGAMQQLARNQGQIEDYFHADGPAFFEKLPTEEAHKVAILDLIILNFDRHSRNTLLDNALRMIPIDHGKSLPTRTGFSKGKAEIESKNFLLTHGAPQMNEQFSPEKLAIIDLIDPDRLAREMKATRDALVKQHPDQKDMLEDESVEMARRSVLFLKKAASHLTVRELMQAYTTVLEAVFDAPPDALEVAIDHAVRTVLDRKVTGPQMDAYGRENVKKELNALGWFIRDLNTPTRAMFPDDQDAFLDNQGGRVLKILQGKIENPAVRKRFDELIEDVGAETLDINPYAVPLLEALTLLKKEADERKRQDLQDFRIPAEVEMGADLRALDGKIKNDDYWTADKLLADLKEFHEAGGDRLISGADMMTTPQQKLEVYGEKLMAECAGQEDPETYFKRMSAEFGGRINRWSPPALAKARYLQECQEFQNLGGKAKYHRLLGKPYKRIDGPREEMVALLKAISDWSVDAVDLNDARHKAITIRRRRLLAKAASDPQAQARELSNRIEEEMDMKGLQVNLDRGQYDAAEKTLTELEAKFDRTVRGDNSDIAKLDERIKAVQDKVAELRQLSPDQFPEVHAIAEALQALQDLRIGWKLPQCETALGKLEKSAATLFNKQAALFERRRLRGDSRLGALESRLSRVYQDIQKVRKDPYLKGRYGEFSRRYWKALEAKEEWQIEKATELIDQIDEEIKAVQRIVLKLEPIQKRINSILEWIKGVPTNVLRDQRYREEVSRRIKGARFWIINVGYKKDSARGHYKPADLDTEVQNAHKSLDLYETEVAELVKKYQEKQ